MCIANYVRFGTDEFKLNYLIGQENPPAQIELTFVNTTDWMGAGTSEPPETYTPPPLPPPEGGGTEPVEPSPDALSCTVDDSFISYNESTYVRAVGGTAPFTITLTCDDDDLSEWGYGAVTEKVFTDMGRNFSVGPVGQYVCGILWVHHR